MKKLSINICKLLSIRIRNGLRLCIVISISMLFNTSYADAGTNLLLEYNEAFEIISPPIYEDTPCNPDEFLVANLKKDWEVLKETITIERDLYTGVSLYLKGLAESQKQQSKFTAWEINPLLHMHINAYLCTANEEYLKEFLFWAHYFLSLRMDNQGKLSFDGRILPQWERAAKYNIFHISPYHKYKKEEEAMVAKDRKWRSLLFSDINYSGLIVEPLLRFVQVVKSNNILEFTKEADCILFETEKTIASHEGEWIELPDNRGYFIFPKNCPFFLDGVEMPVNEAAIFGSALVRAFLLTNKNEYLDRAVKMFNRWQEYFGKDLFGYITYPYFIGRPYSGWSEVSSPSVNTPVLEAQRSHETFHKAALTVEFLILLEQAKNETTRKYLKEFFRVIKASAQTKNILANFPVSLGFGYPLNSYHVYSPTLFRGWIHLAGKSKAIAESFFPYLINENESVLNMENTLYFQYIANMPSLSERLRENKVEVSPLFVDDVNVFTPLWTAPKNTYVKIEFQNITPKHNTLYLYDFNNINRKVRFNIDKNTRKFIGRVFLQKGESIDLRWKKTTEYSAPSSKKENKILLHYVYFE